MSFLSLSPRIMYWYPSSATLYPPKSPLSFFLKTGTLLHCFFILVSLTALLSSGLLIYFVHPPFRYLPSTANSREVLCPAATSSRNLPPSATLYPLPPTGYSTTQHCSTMCHIASEISGRSGRFGLPPVNIKCTAAVSIGSIRKHCSSLFVLILDYLSLYDTRRRVSQIRGSKWQRAVTNKHE